LDNRALLSLSHEHNIQEPPIALTEFQEIAEYFRNELFKIFRWYDRGVGTLKLLDEDLKAVLVVDIDQLCILTVSMRSRSWTYCCSFMMTFEMMLDRCK
jgi:hypothetical protein